MQRRTYLAAMGLTTTSLLAGCGSGTGGNNSSGGGGNDSGSGSTEATGGTDVSGGATTAASNGATAGGGTEAMSTTSGGVAPATTGGAGTSTPMPTSMVEPSPTTATATAMSTNAASTTSNMMTTMSMGGGGSSGGSADVAIDSSEFSQESDSGFTDTAMVGELTAPTYLSSIELQARFRNDGGDIVDTEPAFFQGLEQGQTWNFYVTSLASEPPADGEVTVAAATGGSPPSPSGVELVESSLNEPADEFSGPTITGRAENTSGSSIPYLEARAKFLTDDGTALDSDFTNVVDLPAGETWSFEIEQITFSTDPRPEAADHEVSLATGL